MNVSCPEECDVLEFLIRAVGNVTQSSRYFLISNSTLFIENAVTPVLLSIEETVC